MAKGHKHGNKEMKKPKKEKPAAAPAVTFLSQIKPSEPGKHK